MSMSTLHQPSPTSSLARLPALGFRTCTSGFLPALFCRVVVVGGYLAGTRYCTERKEPKVGTRGGAGPERQPASQPDPYRADRRTKGLNECRRVES